jgi:hypothetical protein
VDSAVDSAVDSTITIMKRGAVKPPQEAPERCHAHKRNGDPCTQPAVKGTGACRNHGGAGLRAIRERGTNITHGRYAKAIPEHMRADYEEFRRDPDILKLYDEIAVTRTYLKEYLAQADGTQALSGHGIELLIGLNERIGSLVVAHTRAEVNTLGSMTRSQALGFVARVRDVVEGLLDEIVTDEAERDAVQARLERGIAEIVD